MALNLGTNERAQRKLPATVVEWGEETQNRELLGRRTEDSSIEFNPDEETTTDVLGITYSDINKTEPTQSFDPYYVMGGSKLAEYLSKAALRNDINAYNQKFTVYLIAGFIGDEGKYYTVKHTGCTIMPQSIGGDSYVSMPIEVRLSNNITEGTVDKLAEDFVFTASTDSGTSAASLDEPNTVSTYSSRKSSLKDY